MVAIILVAVEPSLAASNLDERFSLEFTIQKESHEVSAPAERAVLVERAVVHLRNAVEARHDFACAYALLGETAPSLRHLQACLANDPQRIFCKIATSDRDLGALRSTPEFSRIFLSESTDLPNSLLTTQPFSI